MNIVSSYKHLIEIIKYSFREQQDCRVVGLLFAQPYSFTREEILSGINYFNNRSGEVIDFYCMGYEPFPYQESEKIATVERVDWYFNSNLFDELRRELQRNTDWAIQVVWS